MATVTGFRAPYSERRVTMLKVSISGESKVMLRVPGKSLALMPASFGGPGKEDGLWL
jgi:hypothetical protein